MVWFRDTFCQPDTFWAMVAALATVALAGIAYYQLKALVVTGKADFIYRLKKHFFTAKTRRLIFLAKNDLLKFHPETIPYFEVLKADDPELMPRMKDLGITSSSVSTYELNDLLLGPLEDVGMLHQGGNIALHQAFDEFYMYFEICAKNEAIQAYIENCRKDKEHPNFMCRFTWLYKKLKCNAERLRKARKRRLL